MLTVTTLKTNFISCSSKKNILLNKIELPLARELAAINNTIIPFVKLNKRLPCIIVILQ